MNNTQVIMILFIAASITFVGSAEQPSSNMTQWTSLISRKDKALVFDVYGTSGPRWPTNTLIGSDKKMVRDTLAPLIIRDARRFVHDSNSTSDQKLWLRIDACLHIRDEALLGTGYVDFVMADALTRAVTIVLCKQLGNRASSSRTFQESLARLQKSGLGIEKWCVIAQNEFGFADNAFVEVHSASTDREAFILFKKIVHPDGDFVFPSNIEKFGSLDLLKSPDLMMLLQRSIRTDILLKTLVVASNYKSKTKDFSLDDSEEKIATLLPRYVDSSETIMLKDGVKTTHIPLDPSKFTIGERLLGLQVSSSEVARLLKSIASKKIEKQLFCEFSDMLPSQAE
jgi:hypothetical protein